MDGSVPGAAVVWDHHVTGHLVNLDVLPETVDLNSLDGIGTTMADTDAVTSAAVVLLGGRCAIPRQALSVLACASHWCDHLGPHPDYAEAANRAGRGLHGFVVSTLARAESKLERNHAFESAVLFIAERIRATRPLPFDTAPFDQAERWASAIEAAGRFTHTTVLTVVDLRGTERASAGALYRRSDRPIAVFVDDHPDGGIRYTVGVNPGRGVVHSIRPVLEALAAAEFRHGPPALGPFAAPGMENWGGRDAVGGSPLNYGSRLPIEEVLTIVTNVAG